MDSKTAHCMRPDYSLLAPPTGSRSRKRPNMAPCHRTRNRFSGCGGLTAPPCDMYILFLCSACDSSVVVHDVSCAGLPEQCLYSTVRSADFDGHCAVQQTDTLGEYLGVALLFAVTDGRASCWPVGRYSTTRSRLFRGTWRRSPRRLIGASVWGKVLRSLSRRPAYHAQLPRSLAADGRLARLGRYDGDIFRARLHDCSL